MIIPVVCQECRIAFIAPIAFSGNIRVNALAPGMVDTERFHEVFEKSFKGRLSDIGMGRLAKPVEIANACLFLGSDLSEYISGQILGVDGCTVL